MELPNRYNSEHYRRKAGRYSVALKCLFDVEVDITTEERWADLIAFARGIDDYLDVGSRHTFDERAEDIIAMFGIPDEIARQFPALAPDRLGDKGFEEMAKLGCSIMRTNHHIKTTDSIERYTALRRKEGRTYAKLISNAATPEVAFQPGYDQFAQQLLKIGEVTNLLNSWRHITRDSKNGEIALQPSHLSRFRIIGSAGVALVKRNNNTASVLGSSPAKTFEPILQESVR